MGVSQKARKALDQGELETANALAAKNNKMAPAAASMRKKRAKGFVK